MRLAEGIRKHGFRKWYERQLLQSHAHLALSFLCAIGLFAAIEGALSFHSWHDQLLDAFAVLLLTTAGIWALRRYIYLLSHAEAMANQAECPVCQAYGRLDLLQSSAAHDSVQVRCRQCSHRWRIDA